MRVFTDFNEARNEISRDLAELGVTVKAGYQSMQLTADEAEALTTKELTNYDYRVLMPELNHLAPSQPWADAEWEDRLFGIKGMPTNPGSSYLKRLEVWKPLLEADERFSYTYSDRFARANIGNLVRAMRQNPMSRQIYVSVWNPSIDGDRVGLRRVPCSLGYQVVQRGGAIHMTYSMRSNDFHTHWDNDLWLAMKLLEMFATELEQPIGTLTHVVGSLHVYASEVANVF